MTVDVQNTAATVKSLELVVKPAKYRGAVGIEKVETEAPSSYTAANSSFTFGRVCAAPDMSKGFLTFDELDDDIMEMLMSPSILPLPGAVPL